MSGENSNRPAASASSASTGTFMIEPKLENQYHADSSLGRVLKLFLPPSVIDATSSDLSRFGEQVIGKKVLDWVSDAERNVPFVKGSGRNAVGQRTDELITTEGWRMLQRLGLQEGIVAIAYENEYAEYSRLIQFVKYHIWTGSCAYVTCPSAMQDGAASLLKGHISSPSLDSPAQSVLKAAYERLVARGGNAWTSGQWMTERSGGSDVSGTETLATYSPSQIPQTQLDGLPLGPWVVDGFKWFSSATDSQMSVALAQTTKGLSAFYIPVHRTAKDGGYELNGISISRLKNKLGTKALPTAELELRGARAYLLGDEGNGIREISTMLNITRVHTAVTAVGLFGRGLAIAKAFAMVREMSGKGTKKALKDVPLHIRTLADVTLSYRANMLFTYFTVYLLGISDQRSSVPTAMSVGSLRLRPSTGDTQLILRILTPALKALTAKSAISGLQECMESLGGMGYLENEESQHINIARLYRDVNVLSIWEGTTNVLGTDFVRVLKGRNGIRTTEALERWARQALTSNSGDDFTLEKQGVFSMLQSLCSKVQTLEVDALMIEARELMEAFAAIVTGTLLIVDAESDGDGVSSELCRRFSSEYGLVVDSVKSEWKSRVTWDSQIVFGDNPRMPSARL